MIFEDSETTNPNLNLFLNNIIVLSYSIEHLFRTRRDRWKECGVSDCADKAIFSYPYLVISTMHLFIRNRVF